MLQEAELSAQADSEKQPRRLLRDYEFKQFVKWKVTHWKSVNPGALMGLTITADYSAQCKSVMNALIFSSPT
jgi:hypothetical protein